MKNAIYEHGITTDQKGNKVFAFEVDCFGNYYKMDDSNVPNLISLPYLGFVN